MAEFSFIGRRLPMVDGKQKVAGEVTYIADFKLPSMLFGRILRSPYPHARILRLDTSAAERLAGVRAVLTHKNSTPVRFGISIRDEWAFVPDKARYVGDEVAAVAAETEEIAEEALGLIRVQYEELPPALDPLRAMEPGAPLVHEDRPGNIAYAFDILRGDVEAAFRRADLVHEEVYDTHLAHQAYLEPTGAVASFQNDHLTLWGPAQSSFVVRPYLLSRPLGIPVEQIRVVQTRAGGAFGGKLDVKLFLIVALLARAARRPVQVILKLEEDLIAMRPRMPAHVQLRSAWRRDGALLGKRVRVIADNGAYCSLSPQIMSSLALRTDSLYRTPNVQIEAKLIYTNTEPTGQMRGFGNVQATFAWESHLDMVAERLGMDPVELRLKNLSQAGDTTVHGWKILSCGVRECLEKATARIGWKEKRGRREGRGVGLACTVHVTGNRGFSAALMETDSDPSEAEVYIRADGRVEIRSGENDLGEGASTVMALVAAEELSLPYEDIEVPAVDTAQSPFGLGAFASRITLMAGSSVRQAAQAAKEKLLRAASQLLEVDARELLVEGREVVVKGAPRRRVSVGEAVRATGEGRIKGFGRFEALGEILDPKDKYGNASTTYSFAVHALEVEVDRETGEFRVKRVVAAHDLGRVINPLGAEGQVEGGAHQAVSYASLEELVKEGGRIVNNNFEGYLMPTSLDAFPVEPIFVETIDPVGPYGAKGLAETAINPTAGALANAIYDAVGVRIRALPITPEKVLAGLRAKGNRLDSSTVPEGLPPR